MIYQRLSKALFLVFLFLFSFNYSVAQDQDVKNLLTQKNDLFWKAYNKCDIAGMEEFLAKDIEFYHDKGGIVKSSQNLSNDLRQGLCRNEKNELRREAVPGSLEIFPLKDNGDIYGALMTGEHLFYLLGEHSEKLDGRAKFSHLWLKKDGEWKMHRVISYDHGPAGYENPKQPVALTKEQLKKFVGNYLTPSNDTIAVDLKEGHLELQAMGKTFVLLPQNEHSFFTKKRDLSFNFSNSEPLKLEIFESNNKVEEATFQQK